MADGFAGGLARGLSPFMMQLAENAGAKKKYQLQQQFELESLAKRGELEAQQRQAEAQRQQQENLMSNLAIAGMTGEQIAPEQQDFLKYLPSNQYQGVIENKTKRAEKQKEREAKIKSVKLIKKANPELSDIPDEELADTDPAIMNAYFNKQISLEQARTMQQERFQQQEAMKQMGFQQAQALKHLGASLKSSGGGGSSGGKYSYQDLGDGTTLKLNTKTGDRQIIEKNYSQLFPDKQNKTSSKPKTNLIDLIQPKPLQFKK